MTDTEIMQYLEHWLMTPEIHWQVTSKQVQFLSNIHLQWRRTAKISLRQRSSVIRTLNKHTYERPKKDQN